MQSMTLTQAVQAQASHKDAAHDGRIELSCPLCLLHNISVMAARAAAAKQIVKA